jgi:CheY-like chemotaxis protein
METQIESLIQQDKGKHPQGWAVVAVADTGIGIAAQDLPLVFARFGQVGDTLTGKPKGTGLGLSICKEIIEHHGGQIWLESEWGGGSTFYFAVPVVSADQAAKRAPTKPLTKGKDTLAVECDQPPLLLVIDDEPNICQLLRQELTEAGYRVIEAHDGTSGLAQARQSQPDLLILDIRMPDMSGYDVVETLRSEPEIDQIPVIMLSVTEAAERSRQVGAQAFINKPVDVPHLLETVARLLSTADASTKIDELVGEQGL